MGKTLDVIDADFYELIGDGVFGSTLRWTG
jgi:hypothetical protein